MLSSLRVARSLDGLAYRGPRDATEHPARAPPRRTAPTVQQWPEDAKRRLHGVQFDANKCSDVVAYASGGKHRRTTIIGLPAPPSKSFWRAGRQPSVYEIVEYNLRSKTATPIPRGFRKTPVPRWWLLRHCGKKRLLLSREQVTVPTHPGADVYHTHFNGGTPFVVYIHPKEKELFVYRIQDETYHIPGFVFGANAVDRCGNEKETDERWMFTKLCYRKCFERVWVGKSECQQARTEGVCGPSWDGNTILVHMRSDETKKENWNGDAGGEKARKYEYYAYVANSVQTFRTRSRLTAYVSSVYKDTPQPYATDEEGAMYLLDVGVMTLPSFPSEHAHDPYGYFYSTDVVRSGDDGQLSHRPPKGFVALTMKTVVRTPGDL